MDQQLKNILTLASETFREHGLHESAETAERILQRPSPACEATLVLVEIDPTHYKVIAKMGTSAREIATITDYVGCAHPWEALTQDMRRLQADTLEGAFSLLVFGVVI